MQLIYETLHFKGSEHLENFTRQKMNVVFHKNPEIVQARVSLFEAESGNLENQICEIMLSVPGEDVFVKKNASTYEQSIRLAVNAVQKIMRRRKE